MNMKIAFISTFILCLFYIKEVSSTEYQVCPPPCCAVCGNTTNECSADSGCQDKKCCFDGCRKICKIPYTMIVNNTCPADLITNILPLDTTLDCTVNGTCSTGRICCETNIPTPIFNLTVPFIKVCVCPSYQIRDPDNACNDPNTFQCWRPSPISGCNFDSECSNGQKCYLNPSCNTYCGECSYNNNA